MGSRNHLKKCCHLEDMRVLSYARLRNLNRPDRLACPTGLVFRRRLKTGGCPGHASLAISGATRYLFPSCTPRAKLSY